MTVNKRNTKTNEQKHFSRKNVYFNFYKRLIT